MKTIIKRLCLITLLSVAMTGYADNEIIELPGGGIAEGPIVDGERNGYWVEKLPDGDVWEIPYIDGVMNGEGTLKELLGTVWKVPFIDGKENGEGTVKYWDGTVEKTRWRYGYQVE